MTEHEFTDENQAEFNKQMVKALQALRGAGKTKTNIELYKSIRKVTQALRHSSIVIPHSETADPESLLNIAIGAVQALKESIAGNDLRSELVQPLSVKSLLDKAVIAVKALREKYEGIPF